MRAGALIKREIVYVGALFILVLFIFIPEIMTFQKGLLGGDYGQQFFPYSKWYSENIKQSIVPFYTSSVGCGYSLGAEGQAGVFYPLNIILFLSLPVVIAYQVSVMLHFLLGGIFSYVFIRNKNISILSSLIFALVFMFGANVCGIRYNTAVQKVLIWFPLALFSIDKFFLSQNRRILMWLGLIFLLQIFAGFIQIAFYCVIFSIAYFLMKLFYQKDIPKVKTLSSMAFMLVITGLVSLIQILPTMRIIPGSTRAGQDIGFSLWGSSTPFVLSTLIFPQWDFLVEGSMYMTIALIPFLILFIRYFREAAPDFKMYFYFFAACFILALGSFTPVLPALIKAAHLGFIRKPSKFLFIGNFFLASCALWGLERFLYVKEIRERKFLIHVWALSILLVMGIFIGANFIIQHYGDFIVRQAEDYAAKHIFGKPHHRYGLDVYNEKVRSLFYTIKGFISIKDPRNWISLLFMISAFIVLFLKRNIKKLVFFLVFAELFIFTQYAMGLKGNLLSWKEFLTKPKFISYLEKDKNEYRIYNFFTEETEKYFYDDRSSVIENKNMIYGIPSVGVYAPIVGKDYYQLLGDTGAVDDSLGRLYSDRNRLINNMGLLSFLNVKYIISYEDLEGIEKLVKVYSDGKIGIYRIAGNMPRMFFANAVKTNIAEKKVLSLVKSASYDPSEFVFVSGEKSGLGDIGFPKNSSIRMTSVREDYAVVECEVDRPSFLVRSECLTGWSVYIDGEKADIYPVNLAFQGIVIPEGKHRVEFKYNTYYGKGM